MGNWEKKKLGGFINILSGFAFNSDKFTNCEGIPLIRIRDLEKESTEVNFNGLFQANYIVRKGDLLIGMDGDFNTVLWKGEPSLLNQRVCKITSINEEELNQTFLYYRIINEIRKINETVSATTVKHLSTKDIINIEIAFPSNYEQTRIAEILTTSDITIKKTEAMIAKHQRIKTGLMQDLLTKGIDEHGNIRSKAMHKFVVKNGIEVPEEWEVIMVEEFATKAKYGIVDGPFGSNLKIIHYRTSGIPIIQSGFVTNQRFEANEYLYVDREKFKQEKRSQASPGDLIMAKIGANCGTCALLPDNHPISIIAGNALKITVGSSNLNRYLEILFHFYYSLGRFDDIKSTTAQPAISMASLKKLYIPRPSKIEQENICERINAIDNTIVFETKKLHKLQSLKAGLMQDLLSGRVRVKL